jgi:hypothetical protein
MVVKKNGNEAVMSDGCVDDSQSNLIIFQLEMMNRFFGIYNKDLF